MSLEDRLRRDLDRAAERASVSGDAWDRTRRRYARTQRNRRVAVALPVVAVATVVALIVTLTRPQIGEVITPPPAADDYFAGFWPESSRSEAEAVQRRVDAGDDAWRKAASTVAERFAREFVGWEVAPAHDQVERPPDAPGAPWEAEVPIAPMIGEGEPRRGTMHTVTLVGLPGADEPAWFVAGLRSPNIDIGAPLDGDRVVSPIEVSGRAVGFEATVGVEVRDDTGAVLHEGFVQAGATQPEPFKAEVPFERPEVPSGILALRGASGLGGPAPDQTIIRLRFGDGGDDGWASCTNADVGFTMNYPHDWTTRSAEPLGDCAYFDPDPFDVADESEEQVAAVRVAVVEQEIDGYVRDATAAPFWRVLSREEASVSGWPSVLLEREVAAVAEVYPLGTKIYGYVVDRSSSVFVIELAVQPADSDSYDELVETFDRMAQSVMFDDPERAKQAADTALRCFFAATVAGDVEAVRPCVTSRFADSWFTPTGIRGPMPARFAVRADVSRSADRLEVVVRRYQGSGRAIASLAEDTIVVVRDDRDWLVDSWALGSDAPVATTVGARVSFGAVERSACTPDDLGAVERDVPSGEGAVAAALDELFTGASEGDVGFGNVFPLDARLLSVRVDRDTAIVDINRAADRGSTSCSGFVRRAAIERTVMSVTDVTQVRILVEGVEEGALHT